MQTLNEAAKPRRVDESREYRRIELAGLNYSGMNRFDGTPAPVKETFGCE